MKRKSRRPSLFSLVLVVVLVLGVVAIVLSRGTGEDNDDVTAEVSISGAPLSPFQGAAGDAAVGRPIPEVTGTGLDGRPMTIDRTGPKAIVFLAHWCPHCQDEVRNLVAWLEDNELPEGTDIVSVSTMVDRTRGNYSPEEWLTGEGWPFGVLADNPTSSTADAFGLAGTPFWVFVDFEGNVASRVGGALGPEELAEILATLTETPQ